MLGIVRIECQAEFVDVVGATHKTAFGWRDLPVTCVLLSECDTDRKHCCAELSVHLSVLQQLLRKFCTAKRHQILHSVFDHFLHSLVERDKSPSQHCARSDMFCDVEFCESSKVSCIPLQKPCLSPLQKPKAK
jgi:hypothetical protein